MQLDRNKLIGGILAVVVAAAVLLVWPRERRGPEELIREQVAKMADAASARDLGFVMEQLSERFRSRDGADKQQIKGIIAGQLFRGELVQVWPLDLEVKLESEERAHFRGKFVFARQEAPDVHQAVAAGGVTAYRIDGKLEKEPDGEWRFVSADHQAISAAELF